MYSAQLKFGAANPGFSDFPSGAILIKRKRWKDENDSESSSYQGLSVDEPYIYKSNADSAN